MVKQREGCFDGILFCAVNFFQAAQVVPSRVRKLEVVEVAFLGRVAHWLRGYMVIQSDAIQILINLYTVILSNR